MSISVHVPIAAGVSKVFRSRLVLVIVGVDVRVTLLIVADSNANDVTEQVLDVILCAVDTVIVVLPA